jgi:hypothetical protein
MAGKQGSISTMHAGTHNMVHESLLLLLLLWLLP